MDLTREFVRAKNPCTEGYRWFPRHYEIGGNYQELLDALVLAGRVDDACWLLSRFGPTHTRLVLEDLTAEAVVFAGSHLDIMIALLMRNGGSVDWLTRSHRSFRFRHVILLVVGCKLFSGSGFGVSDCVGMGLQSRPARTPEFFVRWCCVQSPAIVQP